MRKICFIVVWVAAAMAAAAVEPDSLAWRLDYQSWAYPQEKVHVVTDRGAYAAGDTVWFRAFVADASTLRPAAEGSRFVYVELADASGRNVGRVKVRAKNGLFAGRLVLPAELAQGDYTLTAYTLYQANQGPESFYRTLLRVWSRREGKPVVAADGVADITFHPEGGSLIAGERNVVAFKALDGRGYGCDVDGVIADAAGDTLAQFWSTHRGMGTVELTPSEGQQLWALVGRRRYALPAARADVAALRVRDAGPDSLAIEVGGRFEPGMILAAHSRGRAVGAIRLAEPRLTVARAALGTGIAELLLVDDDARALSSRLVFNRGNDYVAATRLEALDSLGGGDYAVAIYGDPQLQTNRRESLVGTLLLQGDLAGHVEAPAEYFRADDPEADRKLELLMLTQGWRRYDSPAALRGEFAQPQQPMELGGELSGTVKSRWRGKPLSGAQVSVVAPAIGFAQVAETDSAGRFAINGVDWPDGTHFAIQVLGSKGKREHNYELDTERLPATMALLPRAEGDEADEMPLSIAGTVLLDEISVKAQRTDADAQSRMMQALGARTISAADLEQSGATSYEQALRNVPGVQVRQGTLFSSVPKLLGGLVPVELWVDGTKWEPLNPMSNSNQLTDFAAQYPISNVESMTYLKPSAALAVSLTAAYGGGALVVKTKSGAAAGEWDKDLFMRVVRPRGYQQAAEVYKPHFMPDPADMEGGRPPVSWYPRHTSPGALTVPDGAVIVVEGYDAQGRPVSVRAAGGDSGATR